VLIEGEHIGSVQELSAVDDDVEVVNVTGRLLLPGLIDPHVHVGLNLGAHRMVDDFPEVTAAAARGGVTTIIDFAQPSAELSLSAAVERKRSGAEGNAFVDYGLHGMILQADDQTLGAMPRLVDEGIASFKAYMCYGAAGLMLNDDALVAVCRELAKTPAVLALHAENESICVAGIAAELAAGNIDVAAHARSRPRESELEAAHRAIFWTGRAGIPLYLVHVSVAEVLEYTEAARSSGAAVFVETCTHYLAFDEAVLSGPNALKFLMSPPLRSSADRSALWRGIRSGSVQTVASDEASWRISDKEKAPTFAQAPNGIPGVESRLPILWTFGVESGLLTPCDVVRVCCEQPAMIMGLSHSKGRIAAGMDADIVILDPERTTTLGHLFRGTNVDWSPYEGIEVSGLPEQVYVRGHRVLSCGSLTTGSMQGRFVKRANAPTLWESVESELTVEGDCVHD
jgi:dihydropyrimidinase